MPLPIAFSCVGRDLKRIIRIARLAADETLKSFFPLLQGVGTGEIGADDFVHAGQNGLACVSPSVLVGDDLDVFFFDRVCTGGKLFFPRTDRRWAELERVEIFHFISELEWISAKRLMTKRIEVDWEFVFNFHIRKKLVGGGRLTGAGTWGRHWVLVGLNGRR